MRVGTTAVSDTSENFIPPIEHSSSGLSPRCVKGTAVCATDLHALTVLKRPGEFGVDVAIGTSQMFGVHPNYGGPHAGFFTVKNKFIRLVPGRMVGVTKYLRRKKFYWSDKVHPQTIAVAKTRASANEIFTRVNEMQSKITARQTLRNLTTSKLQTGIAVCATDLLALTVLKPPGEFGVDVAIGTSQRFGVHLNYGGPHSRILRCQEQVHSVGSWKDGGSHKVKMKIFFFLPD
ncbi:Glycine dehydrogenase (decarboxylating), mitochondrial [Araneus ventricosus]|uniref:Glycine dehydrogenase (Decarboxylating), mitochondrial n=1 Tax=Araneus ventricosus TaxID=182803 RepID=A0A4Y2K985_ARAVE|nr:Glycine dehydrogenase (decarboxylating), mitochondrial [Araneus ventricosus]